MQIRPAVHGHGRVPLRGAFHVIQTQRARRSTVRLGFWCERLGCALRCVFAPSTYAGEHRSQGVVGVGPRGGIGALPCASRVDLGAVMFFS